MAHHARWAAPDPSRPVELSRDPRSRLELPGSAAGVGSALGARRGGSLGPAVGRRSSDGAVPVAQRQPGPFRAEDGCEVTGVTVLSGVDVPRREGGATMISLPADLIPDPFDPKALDRFVGEPIDRALGPEEATVVELLDHPDDAAPATQTAADWRIANDAQAEWAARKWRRAMEEIA